LYDLTHRQEVVVQKGEYKTTPFPCQIEMFLKFDLVEPETDKLELVLPPVYLYQKVQKPQKVLLDFREQNQITLEKTISLVEGKVIIEKAWLEKDRVYINYRLENSDPIKDYQPHFILEDKKGRKQGQARFKQDKPDKIFFSLFNEETRQVYLTLDSMGHLLSREKFTIDISEK